ncbi:hypothetical protein C8R48DRAFT_550766, partial [Suillus tomentosus]
FDSDENSIHRKTNLYYPFSSRRDWQLAAWLLRSGLSMGKIDSFLSLEMIKDLPLSFRSAKELRGRAEMLPSGPRWQSRVIPMSHPTKSPVVLYWRDPIECIAALFNHPLFHNYIDLTPRRSAIPSGATLLGTVLSSDKTNITSLTGDRVAHPLLMSLANIHMKIRLKSSSNAFVLTALLPVPKFIHKKKRMRGVLEDRLVHQCLDIVLEPLKQAARSGIMLSDPIGHSHYCFTPLASYIADTPEAMMLASVGGKTSPVTMAMYKQFGDPFRHEPRTKSTTLAQLAVARSRADPNDVEVFFREAQKFRLNGVEKPFWRDWLLAEPSHFLTPESLHHIHKQFYDHDAKWLICAVGESEIDFRFSVLQPMTGYRHFRGGISKLKQVTGRCQRDIERYIIAVSADGVPTDVLAAVRALMQFRYLVQLPRVDEDDLKRISSTLAEFHTKKDAIIAAGARRGSGNRVINNWYIPKLELMQSIIASIRNSGVIGQWSADVTEHAHITEVKDPARSTNNNNYDPQICRYLDRAEKCRRFELATGILDCGESVGKLEDLDPDDEDTDVDDADVQDIFISATRSRPITNYFEISKLLQRRELGSVPLPLRSFVVKRTALHLAYDPSIRTITVDEAAIKFALPDLRPAIADSSNGRQLMDMHTKAGPTAILPFDKIQVWFKIRVQEMELYDAHTVRSAQTLNCAPPNNPWTLGRYDTSIFETDTSHTWPNSGHTVAQIRLIMRPIGKSSTQWSWKDQFLTYVQRFDILNDRDPTTQLHLLKRAKRSNGNRMGDVIPVSQMRAPINLIPRFGAIADVRLTAYNSMEHAAEFWLNEFWDKTTF